MPWVRFWVVGKGIDVDFEEARRLASALRTLETSEIPGDATAVAVQIERTLDREGGPSVEMTLSEKRAPPAGA